MDSADTIRWFGMYIFVAGMIFTLAMTAGKRAFCHYACWMAPFMMIGRWIRNRVGWPALQLQSNAEKCSDCKTCTRNCPMSLDVNAMVHAPTMEHSECILCGSCIDGCTKDAIRYQFGALKNP
jgi:polyferredoxin